MFAQDTDSIVWDQLVIVLLGHEQCCANYAERIDEQDGPAHGAKGPGLVKLPANKETIIVVVEIRLRWVSIPVNSFGLAKPTTSAIAIISGTATKLNRPARIFHPLSRIALPLTRITMYATMHASSAIKLKFSKKPVLLHILQKYLSSPLQSSYCGKGLHSPVIDEQRLCRPYVTRMGSWSVGEVYDIQFGSATEAIVQAAAPRKTQSEIPYTIRRVILVSVDEHTEPVSKV